VDRLNSQGIPRKKLLWTLGQELIVKKAIKADSCLLCRANKVNEAGLCELCYSQLDDEELKAVDKWLSGVGP
jgi:hypothetical protein